MTSPDSAEPGARPRWVVALLAGAVALVVAAAAVATWFGVAWFKASNDEALSRAAARDEVDRVARQALTTLQTLDYHTVDESLNHWESTATGPLHEEFVARKDAAKKAVEEAKTKTSAAVITLAVTDLNEFDGTATVIAASVVDISLADAAPTKKYRRVKANLQRTGDGWKVSEMGYVDPLSS
jgi:Mce-associated membrane protein